MRVDVAYGRSRLPIEVPDGTKIITPRHTAGLVDERQAFLDAVRAPIGTLPLAKLVDRKSVV